MDANGESTRSSRRGGTMSPLFTWRSAIIGSDLTSTQKLVAFVLSMHMNEIGDSCYPGQETLARETGLSRRAVGMAVDAIEKAGLLEITKERNQSGRWAVYRYRACARERTSFASETGPCEPPSHGPCEPDAPGPCEPRSQEVVRGTERDKDEVVSKSRARDVQFDAFWNSYPKKTGKIDARRAWDKRIKAGTNPADLISGADLFARWVVAALQIGELESMKFVKHPATWLNAGCETDLLREPGRAPAAQSKIRRAMAEHERRYGNGQGPSKGNRSNGDGRVGLGDDSRNARALDISIGGSEGT